MKKFILSSILFAAALSAHAAYSGCKFSDEVEYYPNVSAAFEGMKQHLRVAQVCQETETQLPANFVEVCKGGTNIANDHLVASVGDRHWVTGPTSTVSKKLGQPFFVQQIADKDFDRKSASWCDVGDLPRKF